MGGPSWEFSAPTRFTAGAVGEAGSRVFYFQVFADGLEVNVKGEKQQVVALAESLTGLLADLPDGDDAEVSPTEALPPTDLAWIVGSISIGVDRDKREIVVLFEQLEIDDGVPVEAPGRLRVSLTMGQVRGFAAQVEQLTAGSRPICRLCDRPIDPSGHACVRLN